MSNHNLLYTSEVTLLSMNNKKRVQTEHKKNLKSNNLVNFHLNK